MPVDNASSATETDRQRDAALLADVVRAAGALGLAMFRTDYKSWTKAGTSPVSDADIAVNDLIQARLQTARPDYGWLSEESADDESRLTKPLTWIIDPIDGTRGYIAGREDWCVSAALVENGLPVIAAVFAPATDEFFFAVRGAGASCNDLPITATPGDDLDLSRIAGPKPMVEWLNPATAPEVTPYPRIGSLALRLCRVADGVIDAGLAGGQSRDWDLAAADLIVHEANGKMTELSGDPLIYNRKDVTHGLLVAAGAARHARIVELIRNRNGSD